MKKKMNELVKISADKVAQQMTRAMNKEEAFRVASARFANIKDLGAGDYNETFFSREYVEKHKRFWEQVRNILK